MGQPAPSRRAGRTWGAEHAELWNRTSGPGVARPANGRGNGVGSRKDEYRRRAQQCLEMAHTFRNHNARITLAYMAEAWLRLADNLLADEAIGSPQRLGGEVRPAVQYQQQIQSRTAARPRKKRPSERG